MMWGAVMELLPATAMYVGPSFPSNVPLDMSAKTRPEKWLLVRWNSSGNHDVVSSRNILKPMNETRVGAVVTIENSDGEAQSAIIIGSSRDRDILERQIAPVKPIVQPEAAGPSANLENEPYASSGSSWAPDEDQQSSSDEEEVIDKKVKIEQYVASYSQRNTILKPRHRADAINKIIANRKRRHEENNRNKKNVDKIFLPDSTRKNNSPASAIVTHQMEIIQDVASLKPFFDNLFRLVNDLKQCLSNVPIEENTQQMNTTKTETNGNNDSIQAANEQYDYSERSHSDISNRSDDNVLITNKFINITENMPAVHNDLNKSVDAQKSDEWVPIGSGKTLIHRDKYRKVNWKSYTIATRTLLLAAFPRRTLATHSLTGKKSPAFQQKPAKMCLDPKIVSDIIIEITDRFQVKENLVRCIITTKCADECKMFKMRMNKRKTMPAPDQENVPPLLPLKEYEVEVNQTC